MGKQYVLVEYHYDSRQSKEFPVTFVGSREECQKMMLIRYGKACVECPSASTASGYIYTNDDHASIQDEYGSWRIEWWIMVAIEAKAPTSKREEKQNDN